MKDAKLPPPTPLSLIIDSIPLSPPLLLHPFLAWGIISSPDKKNEEEMLTCNKAGLILFGAEAGHGCCWSPTWFLLLAAEWGEKERGESRGRLVISTEER